MVVEQSGWDQRHPFGTHGKMIDETLGMDEIPEKLSKKGEKNLSEERILRNKLYLIDKMRKKSWHRIQKRHQKSWIYKEVIKHRNQGK